MCFLMGGREAFRWHIYVFGAGIATVPVYVHSVSKKNWVPLVFFIPTYYSHTLWGKCHHLHFTGDKRVTHPKSLTVVRSRFRIEAQGCVTFHYFFCFTMLFDYLLQYFRITSFCSLKTRFGHYFKENRCVTWLNFIWKCLSGCCMAPISFLETLLICIP